MKATTVNKVSRRDTPIKPWISQTILDRMRTRDRIWQMVKDHPENGIFRVAYKKERNTARRMIRTAEAAYLKERIETACDPKTAWRVINEQLRGKRCQRRLPVGLSGENPPKENLDKANEYFTAPGERVGEQAGYEDNSEMMPQCEVKLPLREFPERTEDQVTEIVKSFKNGKSPGRGGFTSETIKYNYDFFPQ